MVKVCRRRCGGSVQLACRHEAGERWRRAEWQSYLKMCRFEDKCFVEEILSKQVRLSNTMDNNMPLFFPLNPRKMYCTWIQLLFYWLLSFSFPFLLSTLLRETFPGRFVLMRHISVNQLIS